MVITRYERDMDGYMEVAADGQWTTVDDAKLAVMAEREACIRILQANAESCVPDSPSYWMLMSNVAAIRNRMLP